MKRICLSSSLRIVSLVLVCYSDGTKSLGLNRISSRLVLSEITDGNQGSKKSEIQTLQQSWTRLTALRGGGDRKLKIALCSWECLYTVAVGGVAPHVTELVAGLTRRFYRQLCEPSPQFDYRPLLKRRNCIFTYFLVQCTYRKKSKGHELMLFFDPGGTKCIFLRERDRREKTTRSSTGCMSTGWVRHSSLAALLSPRKTITASCPSHSARPPEAFLVTHAAAAHLRHGRASGRTSAPRCCGLVHTQCMRDMRAPDARSRRHRREVAAGHDARRCKGAETRTAGGGPRGEEGSR